VEIKLLSSIADIDAVIWNSLAGSDYPFMRWEFLHALESSGAVSASNGWQVQHLIVCKNRDVIAVMPLYLKSHSQGEYVFDHSWASAYMRSGLEYYPKLLTAIPFTPCQGPRFSFHPELEKFQLSESQVFEAVLESISNLSKEYTISGWHCLFPEKIIVEQFKSNRLLADQVLVREAVQFQWFNKNYQNFDDFLETFSSKHRKNLKRERRRVSEQGIEVVCLQGEKITQQHWEIFFKFYQATYWKHGMPEYLNLKFFLQLAENMSENLLLVIAEKEGEIVAGALSIIGKDTLYGRYWGCLDEYNNLHFELCYYQGIEFCIKHKLQCFNSGAQGEHKIARGFEPVNTYSLHWIAHEGFREAIRSFLEEETDHIRDYKISTEEFLPFKSQISRDGKI